jgi:hypothetical protein
MQQMSFYCRSYCLLNMFRAPLCPSSGAFYFHISVTNIYSITIFHSYFVHLKLFYQLAVLWNGPTYGLDRRNKCYSSLLTCSMERSPSREANGFSASQKIPRILYNPKFHYRNHKGPPPVHVKYQSRSKAFCINIL